MGTLLGNVDVNVGGIEESRKTHRRWCLSLDSNRDRPSHLDVSSSRKCDYANTISFTPISTQTRAYTHIHQHKKKHITHSQTDAIRRWRKKKSFFFNENKKIVVGLTEASFFFVVLDPYLGVERPFSSPTWESGEHNAHKMGWRRTKWLIECENKRYIRSIHHNMPPPRIYRIFRRASEVYPLLERFGSPLPSSNFDLTIRQGSVYEISEPITSIKSIY